MSHNYHPHCGCDQCCDIEDSEDEESLAEEMEALLAKLRKPKQEAES